MHCRSQEGSCRPWERELCLANASCLLSRKAAASPWADFYCQRKRREGQWVIWFRGWWGTRCRPGPEDILWDVRKKPLPAEYTWPVNCEMGLIRAFHIPACAKVLCRHQRHHFRSNPCCCWLQPRRDRGSVCIKALSLILLCLFIVRQLWAFQCGQDETQHI